MPIAASVPTIPLFLNSNNCNCNGGDIGVNVLELLWHPIE